MKPTDSRQKKIGASKSKRWTEIPEVKEPEIAPRSKKEHLRELLASGTLMNGNQEHEENVTTIDTHSGMKLIVSGDASGLIKVWNFKRELIREIKFTEPISAICFLNKQGDLIVGHKGKISKIIAKDYLPHKSQYEVLSTAEITTFLKNQTIQIQDDFFAQLKRLNDQIVLQNDKYRRRRPAEEQNKALMNHLNTMFQETPKFGMPMD